MTPPGPAVVIGLDASPRRIGWAIIDDAEQVLSSGTEHVDAGDDLRHRLGAWHRITAELNRVCDSGQLVAVGIEDVYVRFPRQAIQSALTVGNLEAFALRSYSWILVERLMPTAWRRVCGIEQGGKEAPMLWARERSPYLTDQDEADAICISVATLRSINNF